MHMVRECCSCGDWREGLLQREWFIEVNCALHEVVSWSRLYVGARGVVRNKTEER